MIGELQSRLQKKGSMTTLALDNHTWDGWFSDSTGGTWHQERSSVFQGLRWPLCTRFCNTIPCVWVLIWPWSYLHSHTVWGPNPGVLVCHCFSWTVHLSFKPHIWLVKHLPPLAQRLCPISSSLNILSPIFLLHSFRKIRTNVLIHEIATPSTNKIYTYIYI